MTESTIMTQFAEQIRAMMAEQKLTLTAASRIIGIDRGNLSRILNGKERVTLDRAERIANALGATLCVKLKKVSKMSAA
jgi:transcriptional regulator with XRE-family HTH domain